MQDSVATLDESPRAVRAGCGPAAQGALVRALSVFRASRLVACGAGPLRRARAALHCGLLVCLGFVFLPACGGDESGPGFDTSKSLATLSSTEYGAFCSWAAHSLGGEGRTVACPLPDEPARVVTLVVNGPSGCESAARPTCPAAAYKTCFDALGGVLCNVKDLPACADFRLCVPEWPMMDYLITLSPPAPSNGPSGASFWN